MDLTFTLTEQPEWRTITGIQSPVQLASLDDWAGSADPAVVADPARAADSAEVPDSAREAIPAAVDTCTAGLITPALQGSAWEDGSLFFPSLPRQINQAGLLDFMSMAGLSLNTVRIAPFERSHILGLEPKVLQQRVRTIRQVDRMAGSSVTFIQKTKDLAQSSMKKIATAKKSQQARASVLECLGSPKAFTIQSFRARAGKGAITVPFQPSAGRPWELRQLPQPATTDGL